MGISETDKVEWKLDREDLHLLVRSSAPRRFELTDRLQSEQLGTPYIIRRAPWPPAWVWNHEALAGLSTPQLWNLYQQLKQDRVI